MKPITWILVFGGVALAIGALSILIHRNEGRLRSRVKGAFVAELVRVIPEIRITDFGDRLKLSIREADAGELKLTGLFEKASSVGPGGEADLVRAYAETVKDSINPAPLKWEDIKARVLPRLVPGKFATDAADRGNPLVVEDFFNTGLVVAFGVNLNHGFMYLAREKVSELGVGPTDLKAIAMDNLRGIFTKIQFEDTLKMDGMISVMMGDGHDATRLLLLPEYLGKDRELAALVPDRDMLSFVVVREGFDWDNVVVLARRLAKNAGRYPVCDQPLRVTKGRVEVVP